MKRNLEEALKKGILLGDGAMGTELFTAGLPAGACPEEWNLSNPAKVINIHQRYFAAGAEFVETNSFGGSKYKLAHYDLQDKVEKINRLAAALAREAAGEDYLVAGSIGPTGELLLPIGLRHFDQICDAFRPQVSSLAEGGADFFIIETMSDLKEVEAALKAIALEADEIPVIASMTFNPSRRGFFTMMGTDPVTAAKSLLDAGADWVGSNCGCGIEQMVEILTAMKPHAKKGLFCCPNAGLPRLEGDQTVFDETPQFMASKLPNLIEAGAIIIGGCCGTTPEHIAAFKELLSKRK